MKMKISFLLFLTIAYLSPPSSTLGEVATNPKSQAGNIVVSTGGNREEPTTVRAKVFALETNNLVASGQFGKHIVLPAGTYRIEIDVMGGTISRDRVLVREGRTSTVIITEMAELQVNVLNKLDQDLGIGVELYDGTTEELLGEFLSGERILALAGTVDIRVRIPPQSQWWRDVQLHPGGLQQLTLKEQIRGSLLVRPFLNERDISEFAHVIIYDAGTQKEIDRSEPGTEHRFELEKGEYDIFVSNPTGSGKPFAVERAEISDEDTVEKHVVLDLDAPHLGNDRPRAPQPQTF